MRQAIVVGVSSVVIGMSGVGGGDPVPARVTENTMVTQNCLTALGFDAGEPDGIVGPQTEAALKEYARQVREENWRRTGESVTAEGVVTVLYRDCAKRFMVWWYEAVGEKRRPVRPPKWPEGWGGEQR